jgi:energy-coupling factor transport system substrate-specific component
MWEALALWKKPRMVAIVGITALLYFVALLPFSGIKGLNGAVDLGRVGIAIPLSFSVLFGPAAAWGAAFGNLLRDIAGAQVTYASIFGFLGNFLIGYVPYKLWTIVKAEKPNVRMSVKLAVFAGIAVLACIVCGVIIGWGVYWVFGVSFASTAWMATLTNSVWAVLIGPLLLAALYSYVRRRNREYTLKLAADTEKEGRFMRFAAVGMLASAAVCIAVGTAFAVAPVWLTPFALAMVAFAVLA